MRRPVFERVLGEVLESLPAEFADKIQNVEFVVEARPPKGEDADALLGLYEGVPLDERSPASYGGVLPDRIVLYRKNIEAEARSPRRIRKVIRETLLHEIAHYFGISDERLEELGVY